MRMRNCAWRANSYLAVIMREAGQVQRHREPGEGTAAVVMVRMVVRMRHWLCDRHMLSASILPRCWISGQLGRRRFGCLPNGGFALDAKSACEHLSPLFH